MEPVEHVLSSSIGREFFQTLVSFSFSCEIHMPSRIFTNPYGKQPLIGILCIHFVYYAPIMFMYIMHPLYLRIMFIIMAMGPFTSYPSSVHKLNWQFKPHVERKRETLMRTSMDR